MWIYLDGRYFFVLDGESIWEMEGEVGDDRSPMWDWCFDPVFGEVLLGEEEEFGESLFVREEAGGFGDFAKLSVEGFDGVSRVDDCPNALRELEELGEFPPFGFPLLEGVLVFRPIFHCLHECLESSFFGRSRVDGSEGLSKFLLVFVSDQFEGVSDHVNDALLQDCLGVHGCYCVAKSGEVISAADDNIFYPTVLDVSEYLGPKRGAFTLANPDTQEFLFPLS